MDNPYQAPLAAPGPEPVAPFKDLTTLARVCRLCLVAGALISLAAVVTSLQEHALLQSAAAGQLTLDEVYEQTMWPLLLVSLPQLLVTIASFVAIGMWIYRAAWNARGFAGARHMAFTPGWSVGWYFVPFANLWKPYQAMKEIWKASAEPTRMDAAGTTWWLPAWWTLWVVGNIAGNISSQLSWKADTVEDEIGASLAMIANDILNIPLCLVFLLIINRLVRLQREQHDLRRHGALAG